MNPDDLTLLENLRHLDPYLEMRVRIIAHRTGTYVFREWYPSPNRRVLKIQYWHAGQWHDTVEGVEFKDIHPWIDSDAGPEAQDTG